MKIKNILNVSIINTFRLNHHYFGWWGVFEPVLVASRNLKIEKLSGKIEVEKPRVGAVRLGFGYVGIVDEKHQRGIFSNSGTMTFKGNANIGIGTRLVNAGHMAFGKEFTCN